MTADVTGSSFLIHCFVSDAFKNEMSMYTLTHLSLVVILWDIGKQHSPRCDAAERGVPSGAILFAQRNFIEKSEKNENYSSPYTPTNESGLIQLIMMGKSIRQIWVNHKLLTCNITIASPPF